MADFGDMFSSYLGNRMNKDLGRVGMNDQPDTQANVTPVTQTIKSDSEGNTSVQTTGAPEDVAALHAPALQPTQGQGPVAGPVAPPGAPQGAPQPQPQPQPQMAPPGPVSGPVAPPQGMPQPGQPPQGMPPPGQPPVGGPPGMPPTPQGMPPAGMPQGPVAPGAPQAMPPQGPPGQPPVGMPPAPQGQGPVNPAAPVPQAPPAPPPAPAPQAQPAPQPTAETLPGVQAQPHVDRLLNAQNNTAELTKIQQDETAPDYIRQAAAKQAHAHLTDYQGQTQAQKEGDRLIAGANAGDQKDSKDLAKIMASTSTKEDEGSYLKAYILQRFGLHDLSKQEQVKLGAGSMMNHVTLPDGTTAVVRQRADGVATYGVDSDGNQLSQRQLTEATGSYQKGAVTGQTFGKDAQGNVISHTIMPNGQGVVWKNETTGQRLSAAPAGYQSMGQKSLEQLEAEKSITTGASRERQMRKANQDAQLMGLPAPYSENAIQAEKNKITPGAAGGSATQIAAAGGIRLSPNGGDRTTQGQADQVAQWYSNGMKGPRPAEPGTGAHEAGRAIDVPADQRTPENRAYLESQGLKNTVPGEPWHFELPKTSTGAPSTAPGHVPTMAEKIANYEMKPPASRSAMYGPLMAEVNRYNPEYDETKYPTIQATRKAFTVGKQGDTVRSMNVAVDHLDTLDKAATALNNGELPLFNKIANEYSRNTGSPAVTNFDGIKSIVGSEVAKAVSGAGGSALGDREEIRREIDNANSPQQLAGVIKKYQDLMVGQLKGLKTQYEDTGLKDFDKKLSDPTKHVLGRVANEGNGKNTRSSW